MRKSWAISWPHFCLRMWGQTRHFWTVHVPDFTTASRDNLVEHFSTVYASCSCMRILILLNDEKVSKMSHASRRNLLVDR